MGLFAWAMSLRSSAVDFNLGICAGNLSFDIVVWEISLGNLHNWNFHLNFLWAHSLEPFHLGDVV